jgi:hypothetical protein
MGDDDGGNGYPSRLTVSRVAHVDSHGGVVQLAVRAVAAA